MAERWNATEVRAYASNYRPTIWERLGFGRGHVPRESDEEEKRLLELGYSADTLTTEIVVQFDWVDMLRLLVTRRISIETRTRTFESVRGAISASAVRVMAPGDLGLSQIPRDAEVGQ